LATHSQVLVVTHLAQVAAYAHSQVTVIKHDDGEMTVATAAVLGDDDRVVELSRMLSGSPESGTAQDHAVELLAAASASRDA
jgi:DNA repair protein RecN (Recombination protein N)